jgi:putative ABC transport system permease protein
VNPESTVVLPSLVAVEPVAGVDLGQLTDAIDVAVPGTEALTNQEAVDQNPGVSATRQSFRIILALGFVVVAIVVGFFFLILTVQKARPLTLLRAVGAPRWFLVRNLLGQIALVMSAGVLVGLGLTFVAIETVPSGDLSVSIQPAGAATSIVVLFVLALLAGLGSIRRVLRIDPIEATVDASRSI